MPEDIDRLTLDLVAANPPLLTVQLKLPSGEEVLLRPLLHEDAAQLTSFLCSLSLQTRRFWNLSSYDSVMAQEMCEAIGRYDKLRLVVIQTTEDEIIGLFEFSFDLVPADMERFQSYGIELNMETDCRFGPCVADAYQGQGVAALVFPQIVEIARRFGQRRIILWGGVFTFNERAIRFYQKMGFQIAGEFIKDAGPCYDMIYEIHEGF